MTVVLLTKSFIRLGNVCCSQPKDSLALILRPVTCYSKPLLKYFSKTKITLSMDKFQPSKRLIGTEGNIWVEFGTLAAENKALNLGQGFPDFFPPTYVTDALKEVANNESNPFLHQYSRSYGYPRLITSIAETYKQILRRDINANNEILITVGAYTSLFYCHQGFINHGDEVIIIEPFFDCYEPMVLQAGGIPRYVPLKSTKSPDEPTSTADWTFDRDELAKVFNEKTKIIIINNPNNPLGKVYTREELEFIANLCKEHNVIVFSDEVYERLVYPDSEFIRMANLPGMWDRTITIGSAGKTFSVTGWKLGWSIGPEHLLKNLKIVHQNCTYTCATPLQEAIAICFEKELKLAGSSQSYFYELPRELLEKRDKMLELFNEIGMLPIVPEAGYFMVVDISKLDFKINPKNKESKDYQFVKWMTRNKKLSAIPNSAFYSAKHKHLSENLVRFCFIKKDDTLNRAAAIFQEWRKSL